MNKIRMNKRGVIGQTIASIPVMLVIFLVMGIFVAGSILMKNIKKPENDMPSSYLNINENNILLKTINVSVSSDKNQSMMVIDSLIWIGKTLGSLDNDLITSYDSSLRAFPDENNLCVILAIKNDKNSVIFERGYQYNSVNKNDALPIAINLDAYRSKNLLSTYRVNASGDMRIIESYQGACLG